MWQDSTHRGWPAFVALNSLPERELGTEWLTSAQFKKNSLTAGSFQRGHPQLPAAGGIPSATGVDLGVGVFAEDSLPGAVRLRGCHLTPSTSGSCHRWGNHHHPHLSIFTHSGDKWDSGMRGNYSRLHSQQVSVSSSFLRLSWRRWALHWPCDAPGLAWRSGFGAVCDGGLHLWTPGVVGPHPASLSGGFHAGLSHSYYYYCSANEGQRNYLEPCCNSWTLKTEHSIYFFFLHCGSCY